MDDSSYLNIILVADEAYLQYLKSLILSIKHNCPNYTEYIKYHIHLVNINSTHQIFSWLQQTLAINQYELSLSLEQFSTDNPLKKPKRLEKACYAANIRIKIIHDLLQRGDKYLLYMDVDSIILKDLRSLFELIKSCDLTFYIDKSIGNKTIPSKSGIIGIQNSEISKTFFNDFNNLLKKERYRIWGKDQAYLEQLHKKYNKLIRYVDLGKKYIDWDFDDNSFIWVGKGSRKKNNKKYITMEKKYH